jgi:hypothetical protein
MPVTSKRNTATIETGKGTDTASKLFYNVHYCMSFSGLDPRMRSDSKYGEKIHQLLQKGGATMHDSLDEHKPFSVSHMIILDMVLSGDNFSKAIHFFQQYPDLTLKLVRPEWVTDSVALGKRLDEDKYSFEVLDTELKTQSLGKKTTNDALDGSHLDWKNQKVLSFVLLKNLFENCVFYFYQYDQLLSSNYGEISNNPTGSHVLQAITASPPHSPMFSSLFQSKEMAKTQKILNHNDTTHPILSLIQRGNGKIVYSSSNQEDLDSITHIIMPVQCDINSFLGKTSGPKRKTKRVIASIFWLADAIQHSDPYYPLCHPLHYPRLSSGPILARDMVSFSSESPKISISGYTGKDRQTIQSMLVLSGASYTGYFTNQHSVLIAVFPQGEKYERAISWNIPVVNQLWIEDSYRYWKWQSLLDPRYSIRPALTSMPSIEPPILEKMELENDKNVSLKENKLSLNTEAVILEKSESAEKDDHSVNSAPTKSKKRKATKSSKNPEEGDSEVQLSGNGPISVAPSNNAPPSRAGYIISYTGCRISEEDLLALASLPSPTKARVSTNLQECTHLLATKIQRTEKFLKAIPYGLYIVNPNWLQDSIAMGAFLDEQLYILKDQETESKYNFRLNDAIERARLSKLFPNTTFSILPDTIPPFNVLKEILEACGGQALSVPTSKGSNGSSRKKTQTNFSQDESIYIAPSGSNLTSLEREFPHAKAVWDTEILLTSILTQQYPQIKNK